MRPFRVWDVVRVQLTSYTDKPTREWLPVPSVVRASKIATIEEKDAERVGSLARLVRLVVEECLSPVLRTVGA
jgi:hypothetical protein